MNLTEMFAETKPHTRDPKPTRFDPNDPKAKQTHIPAAETFEEYMKRRAAQSGNKQAPVAAASSSTSSYSTPSYSSYVAAKKPASRSGYNAMFLR
jgi:hypothetical protein